MFPCASRTQGFLFELFPMLPILHPNYYRGFPCSEIPFPCKRCFSGYLPFNLVIFHVPSGFLVLPSKFRFRRGCLLGSSSKPTTSPGLFLLTRPSLGPVAGELPSYLPTRGLTRSLAPLVTLGWRPLGWVRRPCLTSLTNPPFSLSQGLSSLSSPGLRADPTQYLSLAWPLGLGVGVWLAL